MADPIRPRSSEGLDSVLDGEPAAFDEVADDEVAGAVEAVVAVDADGGAVVAIAPPGLPRGGPGLLVLADPVHERDEVGHLGVGRRDLGHGRELVVLDALAEALGVVHRVVVADVDDVLDDVSPLRRRSAKRKKRKKKQPSYRNVKAGRAEMIFTSWL